jgi:hypothetical protein
VNDLQNPWTSIPLHVRIALVMLWIAWALSAALVVFNFLLLEHRPGATFGTLLGIGGLAIQAIAIFYIARGNNIARLAATIFLLLGTPGFFIVMRFMAKLSVLSVASSSVGYLLKLSAVVLLFSPKARLWFKPSNASAGGT